MKLFVTSIQVHIIIEHHEERSKRKDTRKGINEVNPESTDSQKERIVL